MHYTVYKVTNKVNGKIYIGVHKTVDLDDNYKGSGKYLRYSQDKHGIEKFHKEILFVYDNPVEMFAKEAELVTEDFIAESNTYNLKVGGYGGWDYVNSDKFDNPTHSSSHAIRMNEKMLALYPNGPRLGQRNSVTSYEKMVDTRLEHHGDNTFKTFLGKQHTSETKKKISASAKVTSKGDKNSQYGTRWIYSEDLKVSKKIKNNEPIPQNWKLGRKLKF